MNKAHTLVILFLGITLTRGNIVSPELSKLLLEEKPEVLEEPVEVKAIPLLESPESPSGLGDDKVEVKAIPVLEVSQNVDLLDGAALNMAEIIPLSQVEEVVSGNLEEVLARMSDPKEIPILQEDGKELVVEEAGINEDREGRTFYAFNLPTRSNSIFNSRRLPPVRRNSYYTRPRQPYPYVRRNYNNNYLRPTHYDLYPSHYYYNSGLRPVDAGYASILG